MADKPTPCAALGDGDVCGEPMHHEGDHKGQWNGLTWPNLNPGKAGRTARSHAGSQAEQDADTAARNRVAPPPKPPRRAPIRATREPRSFGSRRWFGDRP